MSTVVPAAPATLDLTDGQESTRSRNTEWFPSGTAGATRRPLGVHRSGGAFRCAQGHALRDGRAGGAPVEAIAGRKADAVRVPLHEECRPGPSGLTPAYAGAPHSAAAKVRRRGGPDPPARRRHLSDDGTPTRTAPGRATTRAPSTRRSLQHTEGNPHS
ncbi:hypothetical protein ACH4L5_18255 [Streptomyces sp. NPDC017405]|uniref:hypothetical protein n=1 Tax=unclassified Streptomyces TaxID=2593676 RepID=UPI0037AFFBB5